MRPQRRGGRRDRRRGGETRMEDSGWRMALLNPLSSILYSRFSALRCVCLCVLRVSAVAFRFRRSRESRADVEAAVAAGAGGDDEECTGEVERTGADAHRV